MTIPTALQQQIVAFLQDLPNLHSTAARQAFIMAAGLDAALVNQLPFDLPPAQFCPLCVTRLARYGKLQDGREALSAALTGAHDYVGLAKQAECQRLIAALAILPPSEPPEIRRTRRTRWLVGLIAVSALASGLLLRPWRDATLPVAGVIQDQDGEPLPGVTVTLKEFPNETLTDQWGKFDLQVAASEQRTVRLLFRKTGCAKSPQDVTLGNTRLTVQMKCQ